MSKFSLSTLGRAEANPTPAARGNVYPTGAGCKANPQTMTRKAVRHVRTGAFPVSSDTSQELASRCRSKLQSSGGRQRSSSGEGDVIGRWREDDRLEPPSVILDCRGRREKSIVNSRASKTVPSIQVTGQDDRRPSAFVPRRSLRCPTLWRSASKPTPAFRTSDTGIRSAVCNERKRFLDSSRHRHLSTKNRHARTSDISAIFLESRVCRARYPAENRCLQDARFRCLVACRARHEAGVSNFLTGRAMVPTDGSEYDG